MLLLVVFKASAHRLFASFSLQLLSSASSVSCCSGEIVYFVVFPGFTLIHVHWQTWKHTKDWRAPLPLSPSSSHEQPSRHFIGERWTLQILDLVKCTQDQRGKRPYHWNNISILQQGSLDISPCAQCLTLWIVPTILIVGLTNESIEFLKNNE